MNNATRHTSELERLADDVRQGRKVLLFPPGQTYFIGTIMLSLLGFAVTTASTISLWTTGLPVNVGAIIQMASILLIIPGLVFPALMVTRGKKRYANWMRIFIIMVALAATAMLILNKLHWQQNQTTPLLIGLGISSAALWLSVRPQFLLFCELFYLIKRKT